MAGDGKFVLVLDQDGRDVVLAALRLLAEQTIEDGTAETIDDLIEEVSP